jgi:hypothetical protein
MQQLAYSVTNGPVNGQLSGTAPNLTYIPNSGFKGRDSISFTVNDGYDDSVAATINIKVNDPDTLLSNWVGHIGGVTTNGNHVVSSGTPSGWVNNTVRSVLFSSYRFDNDYELRITLQSDPAASTWVVGLGVEELSDDWTDVDYALRSSDGQLTIYENGTWRTNGTMLAQGDELSIIVVGGSIEYRHNGVTVFISTYSGTPEFYVDTAFKEGAIEFDAVLAGILETVTPVPQKPTTNSNSKGGGGGSFGLFTLFGLLILGRRRAMNIFT